MWSLRFGYGSAAAPRVGVGESPDGATRPEFGQMSAVSSAPPAARPPLEDGHGEPSLSPRAKAYLYAVGILAVAAAVVPFSHLSSGTDGWLTFLVLAVSAAVAQLFVVVTPRDQSYHTTLVFLIPGVLLLPPELIALLGVVYGIPEWLKVRYPWYIQGFNIANHTLNGLAAWGAVELVRNAGLGPELEFALSGLVAAVVFVGMNHFLLATMLHLARGHSLRGTGLFSVESLSTDFVLAMLGVAFAALWDWNPLLLPTAVAPLLLIHRSLSVPALQQEARVDPKTGLFNARHFAGELREELERAERSGSTLSVIMADLDLLREINNAYGHLAGDAVLQGHRRRLPRPSAPRGHPCALRRGGVRHPPAGDLAAGGARDRRAHPARGRRAALRGGDVERADPRHHLPRRGRAIPKDGADPNEIIHQADLAVYRAKLQGRNRVLAASSEPVLLSPDRKSRLAAVPDESGYGGTELLDVDVPAVEPMRVPERSSRRSGRTRPQGPASWRCRRRSLLLVVAVSLGGFMAGVFGFAYGGSEDLIGLLAVIALVAGGQALSLELDGGSISVSAVGALAGAAIFGYQAALPLALAIAAVEWSARRTPDLPAALQRRRALLRLARGRGDLPAAVVTDGTLDTLVTAAAGLVGRRNRTSSSTPACSRARWRSRGTTAGGGCGWSASRGSCRTTSPSAPSAARSRSPTRRSASTASPSSSCRSCSCARRWRPTSATPRSRRRSSARRPRRSDNQNVSLEQANRLLKERSTAAMESLSATVDARDAYTAGHSRRVQQLALAIGRELGLSQAELDLLGHAALFHDIGKLAIPDAILLKPSRLSSDEWALMQRHAEEGARIIDRLGFLNDAVPAIRHHHERWDGAGYPDGLAGEEIPLGARIIHVADALDSMLTTRIYRVARPADEALEELRRGGGSQFCPRCVGALERLLGNEKEERELPAKPPLAAAS